MDILNKLVKITSKSSRRIGRGIGSGNGGHTVGRGTKGHNARTKTGLAFAGTKHKKSWIKRLPFLRGKHRLQNNKNVISVNLTQIEKWFKVKDVVDAASLSKKTRTSNSFSYTFKVLATGEITKALTFKGLLISKVAKSKIIAAGGNIE